MRKLSFVRACVVSSVVACAGPHSDSGVDTDPGVDDGRDSDEAVATQTIGPDGGTISVDGAELVVPVGALDHVVEVTLHRLAVHPHPAEAHSPAFEFGPNGLVFVLPAHLTLATDGAAQTAVRWSSDGTNFTPLQTVVAGHEAKADIEHFSMGFAGAPAGGADTATDSDVVDIGDTDSDAPADTDVAPDTDVVVVDTAVAPDTDIVVVDTDVAPDTDVVVVDTDVLPTDTDLFGLDTDNPVGNHPPSAPAVTLIPDTGTVTPNEQHLICRLDALATDADGDSLTYRIGWLRNGAPASLIVTGTTWRAGDTVPSTTLSPGDTWSCYAVANDGHVDGQPGQSASVSVEDYRRFEALGVEHATSCAIDQHGEPRCWGSNMYLAASVPTGRQWSKVSLADRFACGLTPGGEAECYGLAFGSSDHLENEPVGPFVDLTAFGRSAIGLRADGSIDAWGNYAGTFETLAPAGGYQQVTGYWNHVCGVQFDQSIKCWGDPTSDIEIQAPTTGTYSQVVMSDWQACAIHTDGTLSCWPQATTPWTMPTGHYVQVSLGQDHGCALDAFGVATCFGLNDRHQLDVPPGQHFLSLDVDLRQTSCGLTLEGHELCWGSPGIGFEEPGLAATDIRASEYAMCSRSDAAAWDCAGSASPPSDAADVRLGGGGGCALAASGAVSCFMGSKLTAPPSGTFTSLDVESDHACALTPAGLAMCWGDNADNQSMAPSATTFTDLAVASRRSCGVRTDGRIACWGFTSPSDTLIDTASRFVAADGGYSQCGLRTDGDPECFGAASTALRTEPSGPFTQVATGTDGSCALDASGTITCWGNNDVSRNNLRPPVGSFRSIDADGRAFCALRWDGRTTCWGEYVRW